MSLGLGHVQAGSEISAAPFASLHCAGCWVPGATDHPSSCLVFQGADMETCWMGVLAALVILAGLPGRGTSGALGRGSGGAGGGLEGSEAETEGPLTGGWSVLLGSLTAPTVAALARQAHSKMRGRMYWVASVGVSVLL